MKPSGLLYATMPSKAPGGSLTVALVIQEGRVVDGPPLARSWGLVGREAGPAKEFLAGRGAQFAWYADEPALVLVTGSRVWDCWSVMYKAMLEVHHELAGKQITLVHGGAHGADLMSDTTARAMGWRVAADPVTKEDRALWGPKRAPLMRNLRMVAKGKYYVCLAFFQIGEANRGTTHCSIAARDAGIDVRRFDNNGRIDD